MRIKHDRCRTTRLTAVASVTAVVSVGLALAPVLAPTEAPLATATPRCTDVTPTTTICERAGHTQIVTTPNASTTPWLGGFGIGFPIVIGRVF
jgi:hypothetical protein